MMHSFRAGLLLTLAAVTACAERGFAKCGERDASLRSRFSQRRARGDL